MLDDFDMDFPEEEEETEEEESSSSGNRTFMMVAGGLGGLIIIAMVSAIPPIPAPITIAVGLFINSYSPMVE